MGCGASAEEEAAKLERLNALKEKQRSYHQQPSRRQEDAELIFGENDEIAREVEQLERRTSQLHLSMTSSHGSMRRKQSDSLQTPGSEPTTMKGSLSTDPRRHSVATKPTARTVEDDPLDLDDPYGQTQVSRPSTPTDGLPKSPRGGMSWRTKSLVKNWNETIVPPGSHSTPDTLALVETPGAEAVEEVAVEDV